jgi:Family of unknown function (DUF5681)
VRKRKRSTSSGTAVGFRRPPKATQFKAGKSGNPRGRPKGSRSVSAVLGDVIRQKIAVTENGKTRRIPALEVMLRRLANDAMRNDPRALKFLLSLVDRNVEAPEAELSRDEVLAEDQRIIAEYLSASASNRTTQYDDEDSGNGI